MKYIELMEITLHILACVIIAGLLFQGCSNSTT